VDLQFSGEVWFWRGPSPYHDRYVVPLKAAVRRGKAVEVGDTITVRLSVDV
jgi:hypothetical protein